MPAQNEPVTAQGTSTVVPRPRRSFQREERDRLLWLRAFFWLLALAMAAMHTWAAVRSNSMNADGVVYLDMGDAFMRGDWQNAVNPVWSPLYAWILGAANALVRPSMAWAFAPAHVVNAGLFLLALLSFEFFWRQLDGYRRAQAAARGQSLPEWAWHALGYGLFLWAALALINIWAVTPDMLMAALGLLAAGFIARLRLGHDGRLTFALLGLVLGLAYLSKAIMFPLAFALLAAALFAPGDLRRAAPRTLLALLVFMAVSLPLIAVISHSHGSLTFGESGALTYLRYVNGIPYPHWQGETGEFGRPTHPSRQIFDNPPLYEFGEPIGGTYPIATNPAFWYEGAIVSIDLGRQLQALLNNALYYFDLLALRQGALLAGVLLLYGVSGVRSHVSGWGRLLRRYGLLFVALAAFFLYALVYVEDRYLGLFVVLFWGDLLANVRLPQRPSNNTLMRVTSLLMVLFTMANLVAFNLEGYARLEGATPAGPGQEASPAGSLEVAQALRQAGVPSGAAVGVIGYAFDAYWARLAHVQIVAETFGWEADPFWLGDATLQDAFLGAFEAAGACAVVAEYAPSYARLTGWRQIGESSTFFAMNDANCSD